MKDRSQEKHALSAMCRCGHVWEEHFVNATNKQIWCDAYENACLPCNCHNFIMDNLSYVEEEAFKRGLI